MSFLLRHKIFTLFCVLIAAYVVANPPRKFGVTWAHCTVYNRIPVAGYDVYIDPRHHINIIGNAARHQAEEKWFLDLVEPMLSGMGQKPHLLLVGTGFSEHPSFQLNLEYRRVIEYKGISVVEVSSAEAIRRYNQARAENRVVAILLRVKS